MILADTSAWLEYDRPPAAAQDKRVRAPRRGDTTPLVTEPVIMEVTAGAQDAARADQLRRLLLHGGLLPVDPAADFEAAALIYRRCRQAGITPTRGMIDCTVAAVAWRNKRRCSAATSTSRLRVRRNRHRTRRHVRTVDH